MYIVYKLSNIINNYFYYGYTTNIKHRLHTHKTRCKYDINRPLYSKMSIDIDNWIIEQLFLYDNKTEAMNKEIELIQIEKNNNNQLNLNVKCLTQKYLRKKEYLTNYYYLHKESIKEKRRLYEYNKYHNII